MIDLLALITQAHELETPAREPGKNLVLLACRARYNDVPANHEIDQTARALSVALNGPVSASELDAVYSLWDLHRMISDPNGDLEFLLDLPNTEANRDAETAKAEGNLMAAVDGILDRAGCK